MEKIINLLKAVRHTMNSIEVRGIDNQDMFVGCANAIQTAIQDLEKLSVNNEKEEHNGDS